DKPHLVLGDYRESRLPIAKKALAMAGLVQTPLCAGSFATLYDLKARQVQTLVDNLPLTPSLTPH
ncbi:MAG: hypothetical protein ACREYC_03845, partial [Gammaproteobacteria bacterium]